MSYVDKYCTGNTTALKETMAVIKTKLTAGAVVLGEQHDWPDARAVVLDLAEDGCVKKLFLEFWDVQAKYWDETFTSIGSGVMAGELFRTNVGKDLEDDLNFKAFAAKFNTAMGGANHKSPIPMLHLIRLAVKAGVLLYPYDTHTSAPGSAANMKVRNVGMGKVFAENAKADEAGVVLLVGSAHTNPKKHEGNTPEHTLQALCQIPPDRVFKLKAPKPTK